MDDSGLDNDYLVRGLLDLYGRGVFPMADARDDADTYWVDPPMRGIIPLETFNVPRSLAKFIKTCGYTVTRDRAFDHVIDACAEHPRKEAGGTWINREIQMWFSILHRAGHAHSVEVWDKDGVLIGGLYGLAQGGCFNGESMFSKKANASKVALVHLAGYLQQRGFTLLDTQFVNDHLLQFGCIDIPKDAYIDKLQSALTRNCVFEAS